MLAMYLSNICTREGFKPHRQNPPHTRARIEGETFMIYLFDYDVRGSFI